MTKTESKKIIYALVTCFIIIIIISFSYDHNFFKTNFNISISVSEFIQMVASIATALTAYFSWSAIKQSEEISFKPIIALQGLKYENATKILSFKLRNLSKEGDKFARNIRVNIDERSDLVWEWVGYFDPQGETQVEFAKIDSFFELESKIISVSYESVPGKMYLIEYVIISYDASDNTVEFNRL